jgi:hypothetical protein
VPRLLARDLPSDQIRWITGVPAALVTLIAQEIPQPRPGRTREQVPRAATRHGDRFGPLPRRLATLAVYAAGTAATIIWHQPLMLLAVAGAALIASLPAEPRRITSHRTAAPDGSLVRQPPSARPPGQVGRKPYCRGA